MNLHDAAYVGSQLGGPAAAWERWIAEARAAFNLAAEHHGLEPHRWTQDGWRWTAHREAHITLFYDLTGRDHTSVLVAMACAKLGALPPLSVVRTHWWTDEAHVPAVWVAELDTSPWAPWIAELERTGWRHHGGPWTPHITLGKANSNTPAARRAERMNAVLNDQDLLPGWTGRTMGPWEPLVTHLRRPTRR